MAPTVSDTTFPDSASENRDLFCRDLPTTPRPEIGTILVTGASGYVGGRLAPELLARGYRVRLMMRRKSSEPPSILPGLETVEADALSPASLETALAGVHTAYYLIHSLYLGPARFATTDVRAARNFRMAAERCGLKRIIYLGGLGDINGPLSPHLMNRMRVAEELARGTVPVTILRAAVIIGSGSASHEIMKHIVRRLPIIPLPPWAMNKCQPIGIRDVLKYLVGVLETPETSNALFDIGGPDILTYRAMMEELSRILVRKPRYIAWPFPSLAMASYLASLVTPVPAPLTRCLFDSLRNDVVCQDQAITAFIKFRPLDYRETVVRALAREEQDRVQTRWTDAYPPAHELAKRLDELTPPPRYTVSYSLVTTRNASSLYRSFSAIGGKKGWFNNNWMWRLRGLADRILMGVGTSRGRRSVSCLRVNDVIDFWRVEDLQADERLLLRAEMKLPGRAWLEFSVSPREDGSNLLFVTAYFDEDGWAGKVYWYVFMPFHYFIFTRLLEQIEANSSSPFRDTRRFEDGSERL